MQKPIESLADGYIKWVRSHVGHQLIYLVYAGVVIFDEAGRVLVGTRYDFDWWSLPGGAMELRESLPQTARREIREETGLDIDLKGLVGVYSHPRYNLHYPNGDDVQQWTACFWAEVQAGVLELRPDGSETLSLFWAEPDEVLPRTHPGHAAMIRDARRVRAGEPPTLEPVESVPPLQPYYPILRQHVGQAPIILPGGSAFVEDGQGRVLMTRRADFNCWHIPGGYADLGESTTATIVREVEEETGLLVEPYAIVGLYSDPQTHYGQYPHGDVVHATDLVFACRVVGGSLNAAGNDDENTAIAFLPVEDIPFCGCPEATWMMMQDYLDRDGWPHIR